MLNNAALEIEAENDLRTHVEILHELAAPLAGRGRLLLTCFAEDPTQNDPKTGKPGLKLPATIIPFQIGDVENMVRKAQNIAARRHCNVYAPLSVLRSDLPGGTRGKLTDVVATLGLVADFDDADAHRWAERLPLPPDLVVESSAGRFQCTYFFDEPADPKAAEQIAVRLKAFAGCDHGTADLAHVWRLAGCLNWPNAKKIREGRSPEPQPVRIVRSWQGTFTSLADLVRALPPLPHKESPPADEAGEASTAPSRSGLADVSVDLIVGMLPPRLRSKITEPSTGDRSKAMFSVIKALIERGLPDAMIERVIRAYPKGIGEKYAGRDDLAKEIARVRSKASRDPGTDFATSEISTSNPGRPVIQVRAGDLPLIVNRAEEALIDSNAGLYQRGSMIVRPALTKMLGANDRETSGNRLVQVKLNHLTEVMTWLAQFERYDKRAEEWVSIDCPKKVAATYLERDGVWRLPILSGLINAPTLRPDGSILDQPGYDASTGLLYNPQSVEFPPVPEAPTKDDARAALKVLKGLLSTFPFVTAGNDDPGGNLSVALSAILTVLIRRSVPTAPLHGFTAPVAGSGKSMLVDIANMVAVGRLAPVIAQGKTEEEMEKRLGAALIAGEVVVSIDNCVAPLGGELLCQALTQQMLKIRILGKSINAEVPSNATLFATGNNLRVIGDMTRRTVLCSLDPECERPELRTFESNPLDLIRADRPRYVIAALTVLRAYDVAGRPAQTTPLGSFEGWSRWVRDAFVWLGEADPCGTMEKTRAADPKLEALANVLQQWTAVLGDRRVSVKEVIDAAAKTRATPFGRDEFVHPDFREALLVVAGDGGAINSRRLGRWLSANQGRFVGGTRVMADGVKDGIARWRLSIGVLS
jgi:hypothetical protein